MNAFNASSLTADRLVYTLFLATLFHGVVIMGVSFHVAPLEPREAPILEVILVNQQESEPTTKPSRYVAEHAQRGRGDAPELTSPAARASEASPFDNPGLADSFSPVQTEPGRRTRSEDVIVSPAPATQRVESIPDASAEPFEHSLQARLMRSSSASIIEARDDAERAPGDSLRERIISVDTTEAVFAQYLADWKRKIEKVGTLNFPDAARQHGMAGNPILEVAVRADGGLEEIVVLKSSQHKLLDQAALRILRLAAPFDPFPEEIRAEYDVLRFVYEWRFMGAVSSADRGQNRTAQR